MNDFKNIVGVKKIESLFAANIDFPSLKKIDHKKPFLKKINVRHLFWIARLLFTWTYGVLPKILKDIFFGLSIIHKSPATKMFAKTRYDELRILIDTNVSALSMKAVPDYRMDDVKKTFNAGFYTTNLSDVSELDKIIEDVINNTNPSHAGARPYFKDGKNEKIERSYSAYYNFSKEDSQKVNSILLKDLSEDFNYHLSALAGYKCTLNDIIYSLSVVFGANSNDEMHQDTYASVAKGFLYLQDVGCNNAPFEYLEGSYLDAKFRSRETNKAVLDNDTHSSGSTRLRGEKLQDALIQYKLQSFTGSKGLFILANTGGYHRKGIHNSTKPRILLACGVSRKGIFSKFLINLVAMIKFKVT
ncbi:hypothetical protein N8944_04965 [Pseudomonadales bacterium]|nr:hypothetical protein [Pseudomonadales bacterium]